VKNHCINILSSHSDKYPRSWCRKNNGSSVQHDAWCMMVETENGFHKLRVHREQQLPSTLWQQLAMRKYKLRVPVVQAETDSPKFTITPWHDTQATQQSTWTAIRRVQVAQGTNPLLSTLWCYICFLFTIGPRCLGIPLDRLPLRQKRRNAMNCKLPTNWAMVFVSLRQFIDDK